MTRTIGAQIGLLSFAVALLAGLSAGNTVNVVLVRALAALVVGAIVGQVAGWAAQSVLRDHLQKRKTLIDREHVAAVQLLNPPVVEVPLTVDSPIDTEPAETEG